MTEKWVVILETGLDMTIECHVVEPDQFNNLCFYSPEGNLNTCFANGYWLNYSRLEEDSGVEKHGHVSNSAVDKEWVYVWCNYCKLHVEFKAGHIVNIAQEFEGHLYVKHPEDYKS